MAGNYGETFQVEGVLFHSLITQTLHPLPLATCPAQSRLGLVSVEELLVLLAEKWLEGGGGPSGEEKGSLSAREVSCPFRSFRHTGHVPCCNTKQQQQKNSHHCNEELKCDSDPLHKNTKHRGCTDTDISALPYARTKTYCITDFRNALKTNQ